MASNSFGKALTVTTFGESHGPALGAVIDGLRPGLKLDVEQLQAMMDRRRPGGNQLGTHRNEKDKIKILSGIYEGIITGTPLTLIVENENQHSKDYEAIAHCFRPGHADYTYQQKYGIRDPRGGGRASGRETLARTAAGAVAMQYLEKEGISIEAGTVRIGTLHVGKDDPRYDWNGRKDNPLYCPQQETAAQMEELILDCQKRGDSVGGIVECRMTGLPSGIGEPAFDKLDAMLAHAMLSIGAAKGFEVGEGFAAASLFGSQNNDQMAHKGFLSNHAGGILGGISTGEEVIFRVAFKPTPSISIPQKTITDEGMDTEISISGRHDPCIVPRAVVVVEAMAALTVLDLLLEKQARRPLQ
ncbi:MAG: chorismate synthase [Spirochaetia bacterium]|jgi:chorismate synthase|nr:chorismate synthase [Spirochaetia bacterium]